MGSSYHSLSSSSREEGISSPHTDPTYGSATLAGGREGTPVTISVLTHSTESSASYTETTNASEPTRLLSVEQSGMANTSVGSKDLATEMLFTHSSKLLTDSSFQNDLTSKLACPHVWFCFVLCFLVFFFECSHCSSFAYVVYKALSHWYGCPWGGVLMCPITEDSKPGPTDMAVIPEVKLQA